jgi:nucleotide-binding universal stress UspA family protein
MSTVESPGEFLVVVGVDGSESSNRALRWAVQQACRRDGAQLDVVHAWTASAIDADGTWRCAYFETCAREVLDAEARSLTERKDPTVRPVLVNAPAGEALIEAASAADLLVVGARGRGGFAGLLHGSVCDQCTVYASCPVAVVPADWTSDHGGRIVVGVDGSGSSFGALQWAVAEAQRRGAALDVVNAHNHHPTMGSPFGPVVISTPEDVEKASQACSSKWLRTPWKGLVSPRFTSSSSLRPVAPRARSSTRPPAPICSWSDHADTAPSMAFSWAPSADSAPTTPVAPLSSCGQQRREPRRSRAGMSQLNTYREAGHAGQVRAMRPIINPVR